MASNAVAQVPIIELAQASKVYRMGEIEVAALRNVSLRIPKGDFVAITGASGSGKSTMMNLVGCLDIPTAGTVILAGRNIADMAESELAHVRGGTIGFIFQQFNLIPTLTALENVMLPLEFQEAPAAEAEKTARRLLGLVGLGERLDHLPSQLSGGQQQRVAIARSMATNPQVILGDEPTGNLDSKSGQDVLAMLERMWREEGKTIIIVTHDLKLAQRARRVIVLKDGEIISDRVNK
jgi:putative ABC transport system ATP-binding protein